jgi:hypothetical protein
LRDVFRPTAHAQPAAIVRAHVSELCRQHGLLAPALQGPADELFVVAASVNVRRIEKIHAQFERAMNCGDGLGVIC